MFKRETVEKQDRKLEVLAYLRDHEAGNRERLIHVNHILNGEPEELKLSASQLQKTLVSDVEKEEREFWRSFRRRCVIALILTIIICVGKMSDNKTLTKSVDVIQDAVLHDESEKLFDFIQQITYTWEYEKINVKG